VVGFPCAFLFKPLPRAAAQSFIWRLSVRLASSRSCFFLLWRIAKKTVTYHEMMSEEEPAERSFSRVKPRTFMPDLPGSATHVNPQLKTQTAFYQGTASRTLRLVLTD
jgi:hypothetical protein